MFGLLNILRLKALTNSYAYCRKKKKKTTEKKQLTILSIYLVVYFFLHNCEQIEQTDYCCPVVFAFQTYICCFCPFFFLHKDAKMLRIEKKRLSKITELSFVEEVEIGVRSLCRICLTTFSIYSVSTVSMDKQKEKKLVTS